MDDFGFTHLAKPYTGDYYEGSANFMRSIYPRPFVARATVPGAGPGAIVFREDFYDPTTRIRRGRFYQSVGSLDLAGPNVRFEPYIRFFADRSDGGSIARFQFAAEQTRELAEFLGKLHGYDIWIGRSPAQTTWRIIDSEGLADGGILYTLRSRSSFGLLPALKHGAGDVVAAAYQNVVDAGLRFDAAAIVDTCRESCTRVLGSHFSIKSKDLGDIAKQIERPFENGCGGIGGGDSSLGCGPERAVAGWPILRGRPSVILLI